MYQDKRQDQKLTLENLKQQALMALKERGFTYDSRRYDPTCLPITFLRTEITLTSVQPAKPVIDLPNPPTFNSLQSFLGNINWLRPWFPTMTSKLQPLFDLLKGDKNPFSPLPDTRN